MNRKALVGLGIAAALFASNAVRAQVLADKVPGDALIYLGWAGADAMKAKSADTHLAAVLKESRIGDLFGSYLDGVEKLVVAKEPEAAEPFRLVRSIGAPLWKYPTALYVGQVDATDKKMPHFTIALLTQAGEKAEAVAKDITGVLPPPRPGQPRATVSAKDGLVTLILSTDVSDLNLANGTLAASSTFSANLKHVKADAVVSLYADFSAMAATIERGVGAHSADEYGPKVKAFLDESGLRGLKQVIATADFEEKNWVEQTFVGIEGERKGLLKALPAGPFDKSLLKGVPASATTVGVFRFDPAVLTGELRNTLTKTDDQAGQFYNYAFGGLQQALGVNVEQALLTPLGTEWVAYGAPEIGSGGMLGMVLVNKLDDEAAMKKGLNTVSFNLTRWANIAISKAKLGVPLSVKGAKVKIGDADVYYLAAPVIAPSWAIDDGKLYLGFYPQSVGSAIRQARSGKPSILESDKFAAALKTLKQENLDSFGFYDLPTTARYGAKYNDLLLFGRLLGIADLFVQPVPEPLVPPIDTILNNLAPAASGSWSDASGVHARSVQSFPGATMLHGDGGGGAQMINSLGTMSSVLLPSLNRARETADRVKSSANLRTIGQALIIHASENNGRYPDSIAPLLNGNMLTPGVFDSPRNGPMEIPPEVLNDGAALAEFLEQNGDYIYLGTGRTIDTTTPDHVLAYENDAGLEDGVNVLFGDGRVEFLLMDDAARVINQSLEAAPK